jgi:hypothetical protein
VNEISLLPIFFFPQFHASMENYIELQHVGSSVQCWLQINCSLSEAACSAGGIQSLTCGLIWGRWQLGLLFVCCLIYGQTNILSFSLLSLYRMLLPREDVLYH